MQSYKLTLITGLIFSLAPLYAVKGDHNEVFTKRSRGNSKAIAVAFSVFDCPVQSPADSPKEPQTPEILAPQAIGFFEYEEHEEALNNEETIRENNQNVIFIDVTHKEPIQQQESKADHSQNWRKEPRSLPGEEDFSSLGFKKNNPATRISRVVVYQPKPHSSSPNPLNRSSFESTSSSSTKSLDLIKDHEDQSLVVVAAAATLHERQKSSNRFACLSEQEG